MDYIRGNRIGVKRVVGGNKFLHEVLNNPTQGRDSISRVLINDRTKKVTVVGNTIYDNGLNQEDIAYFKYAGVYIKDSDPIDVRRNQIYNSGFDDGVITQDYSVNLAMNAISL